MIFKSNHVNQKRFYFSPGNGTSDFLHNRFTLYAHQSALWNVYNKRSSDKRKVAAMLMSGVGSEVEMSGDFAIQQQSGDDIFWQFSITYLRVLSKVNRLL
jgi:hypothetical protein